MEAIYLSGNNRYALGSMISITGYVGIEILFVLGYACSMRELTTRSLGSLYGGHFDPDGGWRLYHSTPYDYVVDKVLVCQ